MNVFTPFEGLTIMQVLCACCHVNTTVDFKGFIKSNKTSSTRLSSSCVWVSSLIMTTSKGSKTKMPWQIFVQCHIMLFSLSNLCPLLAIILVKLAYHVIIKPFPFAMSFFQGLVLHVLCFPWLSCYHFNLCH